MNRYCPIFSTSQVAIGRFDHLDAYRHEDPQVEEALGFSASLVETGSFEVQVGRRRWQLQPGDIFITYPGLIYRCRHYGKAEDCCLSVDYSRDFAPDMEEAKDACWRIPLVRRAGNRLRYLYRRIETSGDGCDLATM